MADDIWSRYGNSLPMSASPGDRVVGQTEWGAPVYQTTLGAQYYEPLVSEQPRGSAIGSLASAFADDPLGTIGSGIGSLASGVWDAVSAPARAWRGEPVTTADAFNTAGVAQLGSFGATAPAGALRSGMSREAADEIAELLVSGRGADVTDDMMAAADQAYLSSIYDLPLDEASRMARAQDMGFDTGRGLLHGTVNDFSAFDAARTPAKPEDPGLLGRAIYTTEDPYTAAMYAHGEGGQIYPVLSRAQNPYVAADGVLPQGAGFQDYHPRGITARGGANWQRDLSRSGHDGITFTMGDSVSQHVDFSPENLRSRFARFDPRLSHLRNLSAGVAGAAAVPFGLLGGNDEQY